MLSLSTCFRTRVPVTSGERSKRPTGAFSSKPNKNLLNLLDTPSYVTLPSSDSLSSSLPERGVSSVFDFFFEGAAFAEGLFLFCPLFLLSITSFSSFETFY